MKKSKELPKKAKMRIRRAVKEAKQALEGFVHPPSDVQKILKDLEKIKQSIRPKEQGDLFEDPRLTNTYNLLSNTIKKWDKKIQKNG